MIKTCIEENTQWRKLPKDWKGLLKSRGGTGDGKKNRKEWRT